MSGAVFLAWLYNRGRSRILVVAVWHGTFNLLTGSLGARGTLAAVETAIVIGIAAVLVSSVGTCLADLRIAALVLRDHEIGLADDTDRTPVIIDRATRHDLGDARPGVGCSGGCRPRTGTSPASAS